MIDHGRCYYYESKGNNDKKNMALKLPPVRVHLGSNTLRELD